jgi:hypothetical protein
VRAVFIQATFSDRVAAEAELPAFVSQVSARTDFVDGYWVSLSQDQGTAMIVFKSEEGAQALANVVHDTPSMAVRKVEVGPVMARSLTNWRAG